jgi:dipeptidyl aminopeptidase/acylaminoacyl peptidase
MRRLITGIFILFCVLPLLGQGQHPLTFEDMMALKRVAEPVPSPDGRWVLFSAVTVNLQANTRTPHVWLVPTAGGQEREIISDQDADRPRWAPDGKHFAFLSTKEGGSQVWIADFDSEKATVTAVHKLTSIATEADGELWSPDGKKILFVSNIYPACADEACNARKLQDAQDSKVKAGSAATCW